MIKLVPWAFCFFGVLLCVAVVWIDRRSIKKRKENEQRWGDL